MSHTQDQVTALNPFLRLFPVNLSVALTEPRQAELALLEKRGKITIGHTLWTRDEIETLESFKTFLVGDLLEQSVLSARDTQNGDSIHQLSKLTTIEWARAMEASTGNLKFCKESVLELAQEALRQSNPLSPFGHLIHQSVNTQKTRKIRKLSDF